jgi:hypothetical protein
MMTTVWIYEERWTLQRFDGEAEARAWRARKNDPEGQL